MGATGRRGGSSRSWCRKGAMKKQEILEKLKAGEIEIDEATRLLEQADERRPGMYCKVKFAAAEKD